MNDSPMQNLGQTPCPRWCAKDPGHEFADHAADPSTRFRFHTGPRFGDHLYATGLEREDSIGRLQYDVVLDVCTSLDSVDELLGLAGAATEAAIWLRLQTERPSAPSLNEVDVVAARRPDWMAPERWIEIKAEFMRFVDARVAETLATQAGATS